MKTKVKITSDIRCLSDFKNKEGYIDGYIILDNEPCAIVIIDKSLLIVRLYNLEVIN